MSKAISVENLSKQYRLGQIGTGSLSHDVNRWWHTVRGKEDPYLKIGEANDRSSKGSSEYVWSLRDINFDIEQGDSVGIIGRNGAGKSTLLKILSRVTAPTTGKMKVKGRIASLLEVGTGFHPDLSGRDNIYLNGAILGMRKHEIRKHFDAIVDFAGVERYIDTPVKRYSSGMYVRLAFAVAAHLESEILIVDEVLAVGDAEFQKKCLGKMGEVSKGEGRTVLFVSHNMGAVSSLCAKGIALNKGRIFSIGSISEVISSYININQNSNNNIFVGEGIIKKAEINSSSAAIIYNSSIFLNVTIESKNPITNLVLGVCFKDEFDNTIIGINNRHYLQERLHSDDALKGNITMVISNSKLLPGNYKIDLFLGDSTQDLEIIENALSFTVEDTNITNTPFGLNYRINKLYHDDVKWHFEKTTTEI